MGGGTASTEGGAGGRMGRTARQAQRNAGFPLKGGNDGMGDGTASTESGTASTEGRTTGADTGDRGTGLPCICTLIAFPASAGT